MVRMQLSGDWHARMKSFLALPEASGLKGELSSVLNGTEDCHQTECPRGASGSAKHLGCRDDGSTCRNSEGNTGLSASSFPIPL